MAYTPESQYLSDHIETIVEGIDDFARAANERVGDTGEWSEEHLRELVELTNDLQTLKLRLVLLRNHVR